MRSKKTNKTLYDIISEKPLDVTNFVTFTFDQVYHFCYCF